MIAGRANRAVVAALAVAATAAVTPATGEAPEVSVSASRAFVVGRSAQGRAIRAVRVGERASRRRALVVGSIHGDEPEGLRVTRAIRWMRGIRNVDLWLIGTVNPDGLARGVRQNARGVDLNRNFPFGWSRTGPPGSRYYAGRRPASEPETRVVQRLVRRLRPAVTIWYHQPYGFVVLPESGRGRIHRRYARLARVPARRLGGPRLPGTAIAWQNRALPGTRAFVVELPGGRISAAVAGRHARAAVRVAAYGVPR